MPGFSHSQSTPLVQLLSGKLAVFKLRSVLLLPMLPV